jgi:Lysylphosphatidylglycerol synthase TM region
MNVPRALRALLPFAVTVGIFYAISRRVDWLDVFAHLRPDTLVILLPALLAWAALSLGIDAVSLLRSGAAPGPGAFVSMARLKAATYPLGLLHYALGAGGLVVLLRRRAGLALADATGIVMLLAAFDLLALLLVAALAGAWLATDEVALRAGIVVGALVAAPLGLLALRTEASLGPLEPLRRLRALRAAREIPTARLVQLLALRLLFVVTFVALGGAALAAFGIHPRLSALIVGFAQVALVAALPIAVAGLGTSQAAFLYVFRSLAPADELLACSVALSAGMIAVRVALGLAFVREFSHAPVADAGGDGA